MRTCQSEGQILHIDDNYGCETGARMSRVQVILLGKITKMNGPNGVSSIYER